mmetsp:Transcript_47440/g.107551  ORF Transcript_47440/g.107551 Transcript_47440/m.107551 type:complete len:287 (-) Transcript_47440:154-1014(-)
MDLGARVEDDGQHSEEPLQRLTPPAHEEPVPLRLRGPKMRNVPRRDHGALRGRRDIGVLLQVFAEDDKGVVGAHDVVHRGAEHHLGAAGQTHPDGDRTREVVVQLPEEHALRLGPDAGVELVAFEADDLLEGRGDPGLLHRAQAHVGVHLVAVDRLQALPPREHDRRVHLLVPDFGNDVGVGLHPHDGHGHDDAQGPCVGFLAVVPQRHEHNHPSRRDRDGLQRGDLLRLARSKDDPRAAEIRRPARAERKLKLTLHLDFGQIREHHDDGPASRLMRPRKLQHQTE